MNSLLLRLAVSAFAIAIFAGPATAQSTPPVRVGSKIDTEGSLLGNMIIAVLDANGIPTVNKVSLGNTKIVRGAITAGEIDIYPEYTGNGAFFFSIDSDPSGRTPRRATRRSSSSTTTPTRSSG